MPRVFTIFFVTSMLLSSCYTYRIFPKADKELLYLPPQEKVFVENPGLTKEYNILKRSGIYQFTTDSTDQSAVHIRLKPLQHGFVCGNGLVGWAILLGQVPIYLPANTRFSFDKIAGNTITEMGFSLDVTKRYWFWDIFSRKSYSKTAGQALAISYYK